MLYPCDVHGPAHLIDWYLDWAGGEHVARGRLPAESLAAARAMVRAHVRADLPAMLGPRGRLLIDRQHDKVTAMERLIDDARTEGYRALRLETADFMTSARALSCALGFREVDAFDGGEAVTIGLAAGMHYLALDLN